MGLGTLRPMGTTSPPTVLDLRDGPEPLRSWLAGLWGHRDVLVMLAKTDFQARYKRASFGIAWAVVVPLVQAVILAVVFSTVINVGSARNFGAYVMAGVLAWGYFAGAGAPGSTAIVDGSGLTDKVWFPRALLPLASVLANLPALGVSMAALVLAMPILGVGLPLRLALLVPACILLVAFSASLVLVLSALHVYFRDVRFLVQAALLVWFYVTPIAYPRQLLGHLRPIIDANPMTGVVELFHLATVGRDGPWIGPVLWGVLVTAALVVAGVEIHRRHDRLFADLL